MPAKHSLHVVLSEPLVRYVRDKVAQGQHPTISNVVRASLHAAIEREQTHARPQAAAPPSGDRYGR